MFEQKTPLEAHALTGEGWTYLDVRTPGEFDGGHPEGSVNVPFAMVGPGGMMPNPQFLQVVGRTFDTDAKLVVGCAAGGRSSRACQMLAQAGYSNVVNVDGGFSGRHDALGRPVVKGWAQEGLPTSHGADEGSYVKVLERARR